MVWFAMQEVVCFQSDFKQKCEEKEIITVLCSIVLLVHITHCKMLSVVLLLQQRKSHANVMAIIMLPCIHLVKMRLFGFAASAPIFYDIIAKYCHAMCKGERSFAFCSFLHCC